MELKRSFDFTSNGRDDLVSSSGLLTLARDVEFVCFNDRYVFVYSREREFTGLYDAEADGGGRVDSSQAMAISGLSDRHGCKGYYTSWVGPGLLYDGATAPFLPRCASRNFDNEALGDRSWFDRPCDPGPSPDAGRQSDAGTASHDLTTVTRP